MAGDDGSIPEHSMNVREYRLSRSGKVKPTVYKSRPEPEAAFLNNPNCLFLEPVPKPHGFSTGYGVSRL
jgi:hypothetical protein